MRHFWDLVGIFGGGLIGAGVLIGMFAGPALYGIYRGRNSPMVASIPSTTRRDMQRIVLVVGPLGMLLLGVALEGPTGGAAMGFVLAALAALVTGVRGLMHRARRR